jgi:hypothetical protein
VAAEAGVVVVATIVAAAEVMAEAMVITVAPSLLPLARVAGGMATHAFAAGDPDATALLAVG